MVKDYKKEYKDLYLPKEEATVIDVPQMIFIMVDGKGDPNISKEYAEAMEILYGLSYTIKMSKMTETKLKGYFEYSVPPLEGLWWVEGKKEFDMNNFDKKDFSWTSMIRQPEFVDREVFTWAVTRLQEKRPHLDLTKAHLEIFNEGKCVQIMHIGSYDDEARSILKIENYILENGYTNATGDKSSSGIIRRHHEIYLSDPRRCKPDKLKTVIRIPVK